MKNTFAIKTIPFAILQFFVAAITFGCAANPTGVEGETIKEVTQEQLGIILTHAANEIESKYQCGMGEEIQAVIARFQVPAKIPPITITKRNEYYGAATAQQVREMAKPFYDKLWEIESAWPGAVVWPEGMLFQSGGEEGCPHKYPWPETSNFKPVNIDQLEYLFSWSVNADSDSDGIPDWWEIYYGLDPNDPLDAKHPFNPNRERPLVFMRGKSAIPQKNPRPDKRPRIRNQPRH